MTPHGGLRYDGAPLEGAGRLGGGRRRQGEAAVRAGAECCRALETDGPIGREFPSRVPGNAAARPRAVGPENETE